MKPMSETDLQQIEARCLAASPAPWRSMVEGRDHMSGDRFIMVGDGRQRESDLYVSRGLAPASVADQDFVACARQDIPNLIAEVRRLQAAAGAS
mgnify:CR=1 FL=1